MSDLIAREGFRLATNPEDKVAEAAALFARGRTGASPLAAATLQEAFTTSDFPSLLGDAFQRQAVAAQQAAVREFAPILSDVTVDSFGRRKLNDLWAGDAFELVREGEEYKGGTLNETDVEHGPEKYGRVYGLTWELIRDRRFADLANFPLLLGNGAVKGENKAVADTLVKDQAWNPEFFAAVDNKPLTVENLQAAMAQLAATLNHRGEMVPTGRLVLVHAPALTPQVQRILNADTIDIVEGKTTTRVTNPFRGVVTPLAAESLGTALGANGSTAWALLQADGSGLPSLVRTLLSGHENVDIRVKRDQGSYAGGGDVPVEAGSFKDDTVWFRGRAVYGIDAAFTEGAYASAGA